MKNDNERFAAISHHFRVHTLKFKANLPIYEVSGQPPRASMQEYEVRREQLVDVLSGGLDEIKVTALSDFGGAALFVLRDGRWHFDESQLSWSDEAGLFHSLAGRTDGVLEFLNKHLVGGAS